MAHITADRVRDTSTTTGTGALTVSGSAPAGYRTFSAVCSTSDTFWYAVQHQSAAEWEVGLGTYSAANQITRTTILASSNSGSAVNFSAGTKDVFITLAATKTVQQDSAGNVGIGTSSPSTPLTVKAESSGFIGIRVLEAASTAGSIQFTNDPVTVERGSIIATNSGNMRFYGTATVESYTSNTERMRITSAGNVGIGTTTPTAGAKLDVSGGNVYNTTTSTGSTGYYVWNGTAVGASLSCAFSVPEAYLDFNTTLQFRSSAASFAERMRVNAAGELLIGTTTDNGAFLLQVNSQIWATNATIATSDARLKENVQPITNALDTINRVKAVAFDFKQDSDLNLDAVRQTGFLAQDLDAALAGEDYKDSIVKECGPYFGVAYEKMVPVLVAALQEAVAKIDALEARVASLEGAN
jgi:hypothetical protein